MPHAPHPDSRSRAIVPIVSLGLTTLLCCAESALEVAPERAPERRREVARPTVLPPEAGKAAAPPVAPTESAPAKPAAEEAAAVAALPHSVRVRLERVRSPGRIDFGIAGSYRIFQGALVELEDDRRPLLASGSNLRFATADCFQGGVRINGHTLASAEVTIVPGSPGSLKVGERRYAGGLILRAGTGELAAINLVELEEYVSGVLYAEMPERFGNEALRAQAVVSRTFALYHAQRGRELRDDQGSQVYAGLERADASARRIVDSTLGEVVTFGGIPFEAYFHSTCGGSTSSARAVFGIQAPSPLDQCVECTDCQASPHWRWSRKVPRGDLDKLYRNTRTSNLRFASLERDRAGRTLRFEVVAGDGKPVDKPIADRLRNDFNAGKPLSKQLPSTFVLETKAQGKTLLVEGRGFGHGVGLCQYGAGGLAGRGVGYRSILERYFPGATVTRLYD